MFSHSVVNMIVPAFLAILGDPQFWSACSKIVFLNLLLSGDNALVIAMATRSLPKHQQKWGRIFGAAGAVVLRIVFVLLLAQVLRWPYLQFIGGGVLVLHAGENVCPSAVDGAKGFPRGTSLEAIGLL